MKTREEIQSEVAICGDEPEVVQATEAKSLTVFPPSVGLMMALRAVGNTLAASLEDPTLTEQVTQEDTLVFYWAVTTAPKQARQMLCDARRSGDFTPILRAAEDLSWDLTPYAMSQLNAAIERTREQVQAVSVSIIPDKSTQDSKN